MKGKKNSPKSQAENLDKPTGKGSPQLDVLEHRNAAKKAHASEKSSKVGASQQNKKKKIPTGKEIVKGGDPASERAKKRTPKYEDLGPSGQEWDL